ncbi:Flagellar hook-associated protein flgK [Chryseobacterium sp. JV274]|nr:Flagellar hook-associated protein flgK [Chryseobacterium sp. JV274]
MKVYSHFFREILLKKYLYVIPLIISSYLTGQTITVGGSNWTVSVPSITEAGTNYAGTYQSATNLITLSGTLPGSFLNLLTSGAARISMHHTPTTWNSNLHLYAKRSGGTTSISGLCLGCTATINGGTTYVEIPQAVDTAFFTINFSGILGLGNSVTFSGINGQLQISGVSVIVPATTYNTQIVFTIGPN